MRPRAEPVWGGPGVALLVSLLEEPGPVEDRPRHEARKDKVEGCGEVPVVLEVVDQEPRVGRHEGRLDGAQVDAGDLQVSASFCREARYRSVVRGLPRRRGYHRLSAH